jgi:hypothetical protein
VGSGRAAGRPWSSKARAQASQSPPSTGSLSAPRTASRRRCRRSHAAHASRRGPQPLRDVGQPEAQCQDVSGRAIAGACIRTGAGGEQGLDVGHRTTAVDGPAQQRSPGRRGSLGRRLVGIATVRQQGLQGAQASRSSTRYSAVNPARVLRSGAPQGGFIADGAGQGGIVARQGGLSFPRARVRLAPQAGC